MYQELKESSERYYDSFLKKKSNESVEEYAARAAYLAATRRAINYEGRNAYAQVVRAEMTPVVAEFLSGKDFSNNKCLQLMNRIRAAFKNAGIENWTYGNSQKWVNIAIKYYFAYKFHNAQPESLEDYHSMINAYHYELCPIDGIMIGVFKDKLNLNFYDYSRKVSWSNCDEISVFMNFWSMLKHRIASDYGSAELPLMFEFENFPVTLEP